MVIMQKSLNILLVDDVEFIQQIISNMLLKLGHRCDIANNGEVALSRMAQSRYDVVLMDIQMPIMDGLTATRRAREQGMKLPIIAISGNTLPEDQQACFDAGMNAFIKKPPTLSSLQAELDRFC